MQSHDPLTSNLFYLKPFFKVLPTYPLLKWLKFVQKFGVDVLSLLIGLFYGVVAGLYFRRQFSYTWIASGASLVLWIIFTKWQHEICPKMPLPTKKLFINSLNYWLQFSSKWCIWSCCDRTIYCLSEPTTSIYVYKFTLPLVLLDLSDQLRDAFPDSWRR